MAVGENPSPVLAKACLNPDKLTPEDRLVLRSYFRAWLTVATRLRDVQRTGDFDFDWRVAARLIFEREIVPYDYGRHVLMESLDSMPDVAEVAAEVVADDPSCRDLIFPRETGHRI